MTPKKRRRRTSKKNARWFRALKRKLHTVRKKLAAFARAVFKRAEKALQACKKDKRKAAIALGVSAALVVLGAWLIAGAVRRGRVQEAQSADLAASEATEAGEADDTADATKETSRDEDAKTDARADEDGFYVTYDVSPGTFADGSSVIEIFYLHGEGTYEDDIPEIVYDGYELRGWSYDGETWDINVHAAKEGAENATLRALFVTTGASVVYMPNGAFGDPMVMEYEVGDEVALEECPYSNGEMIFEGWSTDETGAGELYQPSEEIEIEEDEPLTLYAQWVSPDEYGLAVVDSDAGLYDPSRASIKGILPYPHTMLGDELRQLGVRQVIYNIYLSHFLDPKGGATVPFTYGGKEYYFNKNTVETYDQYVASFAANGFTTTMVILNDKGGANPLIHQAAGAGTWETNLYMLATTPEALEMERAVGAFLAGRYAHVRNWIIGNEIDAYVFWNYMPTSGIGEYVSEYSKGFRAFYEGITGANYNARVYMPLTHNWTGNIGKQFAGRDVLDLFAATNSDIRWHLAYHPYNNPQTDATAWDSSYTSMDFDTRTITMQNIAVLTSYMGKREMRNPDGTRKSVIVSECGYTSSAGQETQAASIIYGYYQALKNPYIDAYLYTREMDAPEETAVGLAMGLKNPDGSRKLSWSWYAAMGTANQQSVIDQALSYVP